MTSFFQVLFRYALAIFKCFEEKLLRQTDYMSIFNCFRAELQSLFDIKKLTKVFVFPGKFPQTNRNVRDYDYGHLLNQLNVCQIFEIFWL